MKCNTFIIRLVLFADQILTFFVGSMAFACARSAEKYPISRVFRFYPSMKYRGIIDIFNFRCSMLCKFRNYACVKPITIAQIEIKKLRLKSTRIFTVAFIMLNKAFPHCLGNTINLYLL